MKKLVLIFVLFTCFAITAAAQNNCQQINAPALLGLRLKMTPEEAQAIVGNKLKIKIKTDDEKVIFQNYIEDSPPPTLAGVRALYLRFLDRRLYQIEVFYQENPAFQTLEDFTNSVAEKWNFPPAIWQREEIRSVISCDDYSIVAMKILNPKLELTDETARAKAGAIREKEKK